MLFKSFIFLFIFCLLVLFIIGSGALKSLTIIVEMSIFPFSFVDFRIIYLMACYQVHK